MRCLIRPGGLIAHYTSLVIVIVDNTAIPSQQIHYYEPPSRIKKIETHTQFYIVPAAF